MVDCPSEVSMQSLVLSDNDNVFKPDVLNGRGARGKLKKFQLQFIGNWGYDTKLKEISYTIVNEANEKTWMPSSKLKKGRITDLLKLRMYLHNDMEKRIREAECRRKGYTSPWNSRPIIIGQDRLNERQYKILKRKIRDYEKRFTPKCRLL